MCNAIYMLLGVISCADDDPCSDDYSVYCMARRNPVSRIIIPLKWCFYTQGFLAQIHNTYFKISVTPHPHNVFLAILLGLTPVVLRLYHIVFTKLDIIL